MEEPLEILTERVAQAADELKRHYGARRVHVLRVGIRRIRTFLKQSGDHRAKRMRKIWGGFAGATNDARDWDVFHKTARALLGPDEYRTFRRLNRKRLEASHHAVKALVNSEHWDSHLDEWRRYLERSTSRAATDLSPARGDRVSCRSPRATAFRARSFAYCKTAPPPLPALAGDEGPDRPQTAPGTRRPAAREQPSLDAVLEKAGIALARALQADDDRTWHKFRIAVKETRYIAEAATPQPPGGLRVIATCKALQATLGEWHDTVVQLQLLDEMAPHPVHARLRSLIRRRKTASLSQTRTLLEAQSIFAPVPGGDGPEAPGA